MKVSVIFGTRPEAIKMAPIVMGLQKHPILQGHICVTGQHREMLDQVLDAFSIQPDVDLNLMRENQSLGMLSSRLLESLDHYLEETQPDLVLVQGDTATAFAGALAAFYKKIPVGHIEAGLRTYDMYSPWPEEANRVMISKLASIHFAPTQDNRKALKREGIFDGGIFVTGNTVIDALHYASAKVKQTPLPIPGLSPELLDPNGPPIVLITGHRRENFGPRFESICRAIAQLADTFPRTHFVYPVHLNPHVREPVNRILRAHSGARLASNIHLIEPLSYLPFVQMMNRSTLILTDSGGIQEEAPSLSVPVLVMRETTERMEAVDAGTIRVVGTKTAEIVGHACDLLTDPRAHQMMAQARNPYGDGTAAKKILDYAAGFLRADMTMRTDVDRSVVPIPETLPLRMAS